ncbi:MAG: hypothetical protein M1833_002686 [Piccolia ochrophora]|nr:MAG: hypothetical protein M1833_002686 [Piccolia ochrophora]
MPRNAYLYDFYMHGSIKPLEVANGLRPGDVWYVLNDFSLILATIVKALQNFMSVDEQADLDMLNIVGSGDAEQLAADDRAPESESLLSSRNPQPAQPQVTGEKAKTEAVAESWDDEELGDEHETAVAESWDDDDSSDDEESSDDESDDLGTQDKSSRRGQPFKPWGDDEGKGLLNVLKAFQKLRTEFDTKFKAIWS